MTQNLPIVRTEFANRMKRAMYDFSVCIDAPEIGMSETDWWYKFFNWQVERMRNQLVEEMKHGSNERISFATDGRRKIEAQSTAREIEITRNPNDDRIFRLADKGSSCE